LGKFHGKFGWVLGEIKYLIALDNQLLIARQFAPS